MGGALMGLSLPPPGGRVADSGAIFASSRHFPFAGDFPISLPLLPLLPLLPFYEGKRVHTPRKGRGRGKGQPPEQP